MLLAAPPPASAAPAPTGPTTPAGPGPNAWILVDADSGVVLDGVQTHAAMLPASTVKVMTALTAIEYLPPGALITVSSNAAAREPMKIDMRAGETWPLRPTLQSLLMVSANDAAYALAETAGGSVAGFADQMNQTARRLGMRDSTFADPAGLDDQNSYNGGSTVSAYDLAIAGRNLLSVPELAEIVGTRRATFVDPRGTARSLPNHNRLLSIYDGATGLKTGFTRRSGRTLIASATRNGRTMIAVILGYADYYGFAAQLFDQGFATPKGARGTGEVLPPPRIAVASQVPRGDPPTSASPSPPGTETSLLTRARQAGTGLSWITPIALVVLLAITISWQRARVRSRRRARLARERRIEAARRRAVLSPIGLGEDRRPVRRR